MIKANKMEESVAEKSSDVFWDGTGIDPYANIDITKDNFWDEYCSEQKHLLGYQPQIYYYH